MLCPKCHYDNTSSARFCESCGAKLARLCSSCGEEVGLQAQFCSACGAPVAPPGPLRGRAIDTGAPGDRLAGAPEGERRQLTVLFCDLVGSTEIAAQLDPEEWRDIAARYQRAAGEAVTRCGGHIAKYLGDGLMAYFGYPQAQEDDPERAVRAGLAIIEAVQQLSADPGVRHAGSVGLGSVRK